VTLKKKKTPTTIKKQTEAHLHELYLRFIKPLEYDSDYWLSYWSSLEHHDSNYFKSVIASLEEARLKITLLRSIYVPNRPALPTDADSFFEVAKREVADPILSKIHWRKELKNVIKSCVSEEDPTAALEEKLSCPPGLIIDLLIHLLNLFPNKMSPLYWSVNHNTGVMFHLNLRFPDKKITEAIDGCLEYFLSHEGRRFLDWLGYRPQLADGQALEVIRNPGKGPYGQDLESSMLVVSIDFNAGKMRIRKELKELLKKFSSRDTESTPKFYPNTWELAYEIYRLHRYEGFKFKEISLMLNIPESTVKSAFQRVYLHIHQEDEYGTAETRGELSVNIAERSPISLEDAETIYARAQILGGIGNKMAPSAAYESTKLSWKADLKERAFDSDQNWRKRFGQGGECWGCKRVPGSGVCSGCNQALEPVYLARGLKRWAIIPGKAVPKSPEIDNVRYRKSEAQWKGLDNLIRPGIDRNKELSLQTDYMKHNGIEILPPRKEPKPKDGAVRVIPHSSGKYSLDFILRKDLLEWVIVNQIDLRRAKKSHH
jgi:hypothetical protein